MLHLQGEPEWFALFCFRAFGDKLMRRLNRRRSRREEWDAEPVPSPLDVVPEEDFYDEYDEYGEDYPDAPIEPFVPVPGDDYETYDNSDVLQTETAYPARESRRRLRLPRLRVPSLGLQWGYLLLTLVLIVGGVFGTLLNRDQVSGRLEEWWPAAIIIMAGLWMLIALVRRQATSFLGGAALAGVGLSLIMHKQDIADYQETLLGMVLVTAGLGIVIRGFLLRQRTPMFS